MCKGQDTRSGPASALSVGDAATTCNYSNHHHRPDRSRTAQDVQQTMQFALVVIFIQPLAQIVHLHTWWYDPLQLAQVKVCPALVTFPRLRCKDEVRDGSHRRQWRDLDSNRWRAFRGNITHLVDPCSNSHPKEA